MGMLKSKLKKEDREKIKIRLEKREELIDCKVGDFRDNWNDSK